MLRYLFNVFLILFFYEGSNLYENSWIKVNKNDCNIYKFHEENAASVFNLKKRLCGNTEKHTNTAYIGISIVQEETTLTFPICEKVIFSAHTIDSYPSESII